MQGYKIRYEPSYKTKRRGRGEGGREGVGGKGEGEMKKYNKAVSNQDKHFACPSLFFRQIFLLGNYRR